MCGIKLEQRAFKLLDLFAQSVIFLGLLRKLFINTQKIRKTARAGALCGSCVFSICYYGCGFLFRILYKALRAL
ncbi:MAG: hypothetical protein IIV03_03300 [Clostridia bacterium]|nr:hypothetical protein [Clostridia bacterium]